MNETEPKRSVEDLTRLSKAWDQEDAMMSIAISLKRIADSLESFVKGHFMP